jgi:hypothetical protein
MLLGVLAAAGSGPALNRVGDRHVATFGRVAPIALSALHIGASSS